MSSPPADASLSDRLAQFGRCELGVFPSPVRPVSARPGGHFWIKDDGACSECYGGNKVRKLEYLFAEARRTGHKTLVVHGDIGSHTVQACGLLGRQAGFGIHAVVFPHQGQTASAPELDRLRSAGVRLHVRRTMLAAVCHAHWLGWRRQARVVPLGASTPVATLGQVRAALELQEQVRAGLLPEPRRIYLPFATGGSVAGLLIGLALRGAHTKVVAVRSVESLVANRRRLERLVGQTLQLLGYGHAEFVRCLAQLEAIDHDQLGRGFRDATAAATRAVAVADELGLALETAYSGKAFAALLGALPHHADGELLFWNTHAAPEPVGAFRCVPAGQ